MRLSWSILKRNSCNRFWSSYLIRASPVFSLPEDKIDLYYDLKVMMWGSLRLRFSPIDSECTYSGRDWAQNAGHAYLIILETTLLIFSSIFKIFLAEIKPFSLASHTCSSDSSLACFLATFSSSLIFYRSSRLKVSASLCLSSVSNLSVRDAFRWLPSTTFPAV